MSPTNNAAALPPSDDEVQRRLDEGLGRLDTAQAEGLRHATLIQGAQAAGAERERARLATKYGADHPRVRTAQARVAAESRLSGALQVQAAAAAAPAPRVDQETWAVQGRVLCSTGEPAAGLTVSLAYPGGGWEQAAGHVCTDKAGVFVLRHRPQTGGQLQLVVSQGATVLHRDSQLLTPVPGTIDNRVIVLPAGADACPPPWDDGVVDGGQGGDGDNEALMPGGGGAWSVRGRVTDASGNAAAGLTVSLYDQDLIFDDRLGQTTTNTDGDYVFTYRTRDFRDFIEARPDLYLKILDDSGQTLHTAPVRVRAEAGREEVIDVKLPKPKK